MKSSKKYEAPEFLLVKKNEAGRVFFAGSVTPTPSLTGSISKMTVTNGTW